ncbi:unnamed protein product, partial [Soboliphyme baturini]|uniref:Uncharacterized protein n=1 Tax=Soboliphyme baturini TaxID=241478 RepID=A0A183IHQ9_9BILA
MDKHFEEPNRTTRVAPKRPASLRDITTRHVDQSSSSVLPNKRAKIQRNRKDVCEPPSTSSALTFVQRRLAGLVDYFPNIDAARRLTRSFTRTLLDSPQPQPQPSS